jgi:hypothetical protein
MVDLVAARLSAQIKAVGFWVWGLRVAPTTETVAVVAVEGHLQQDQMPPPERAGMVWPGLTV